MAVYTVLSVQNQLKTDDDDRRGDGMTTGAKVIRITSTALLLLLIVWILNQVIRIYKMSQWYLDLLYERYEFNLTRAYLVSNSACFVFTLCCMFVTAIYLYMTIVKMIGADCGEYFRWSFFGFWLLMKINTAY